VSPPGGGDGRDGGAGADRGDGGDGWAGADRRSRGLEADLRLRRGALDLVLSLSVRPGEVVALLGPNGAGKSTALRVLAGLVPADSGSVRLGGTAWQDGVTGAWTPPERRGAGVVFQDYLLFPHLSALDNVAFGLRCAGAGRAAARDEARRWLERVGVGELARSRPAALSGGQAQRVALARALAPRPGLLLLDEPLAALDARTRLAVRSELRRHLAAFEGCAVVVTHDPLDAMVLADSLVVLEEGRVVQTGRPADVARHPRTAYVARLVGLNLYRGRAAGGAVVVGEVPVRASTPPGPDGAQWFVAFPPAAVAVYRSRPDGSPRNVWPARVAGVEPYGDALRLELDGPLPVAADVTALAAAELDLVTGSEVWASVKASEVEAYPA